MSNEAIWVTGPSRSGKTHYLVQQFCSWVAGQGAGEIATVEKTQGTPTLPSTRVAQNAFPAPGVLVLAAIGDNRLDLVDRLTAATQGRYPFYATTPLGFFQDEVMLFYPLLVQELDLRAQFPLRLAPENEQELAARLWRSFLDPAVAQASSISETRLVRRVLDLLQLAALAGIPLEDIPSILEQGLAGQEHELPIPPDQVGAMLQQWQTWCLDRGLLTYSLLATLYWRYLLPHPNYRQHLVQRYSFLLADDVDECPAIARPLFEVFLDARAKTVLTFNPEGAVRLGLGADPNYLSELASRCRLQRLLDRPVSCVGNDLDDSVVQLVTDPLFFFSLPESIQAIQTTSRAQLLRRTAEIIIAGVRTHQIQPRDVAVIAPGMDAIARYSLTEILAKHQIPVESLNDQRPLASSPVIRALLTLLTLVYPGLGRLVDRDAVAEMLVVLSRKQGWERETAPVEVGENMFDGSTLDSAGSQDISLQTPDTALEARSLPYRSLIDPVRAGLLADHCFVPHPDRPRLLPATTFPRWDRLGYQTSTAYGALVAWIEGQKAQLEQRLLPSAIVLLDRAIQQFLLGGSVLPFDQLAALRQLLESAQHYWEVSDRLSRSDRTNLPASLTVSRFIQLLRSGTVTANPYPVRPIGPGSNAVTLANVFQYRANRRAHRWQFWMDAGSPRWLSGVDALFGAPLFLQAWSGRPWTSADMMQANENRLRRILLDLLGRAEERIYLCHSDLATSGQEQTGVLLSLVNVAVPLSS